MNGWKEKTSTEKKTMLHRIWVGIFLRIGFFALTVGCIFTFVFGIHLLEGNDMYPAMKDGDLLVIYRLGNFNRWDVVEYQVDGKKYVGRIVGTEGTVVSTTEDGRLTLDGRFQPIQPRKGIYEETMASDLNRGDVNPEKAGSSTDLVLAKDTYYILSDRRSDATDSRTFGAISRNQIRGKVFTLWRRRDI